MNQCQIRKRQPMMSYQLMAYINKASVKTFDRDIFRIKTGFLFQNDETSEFKKLHEVFYKIRTVRDLKGNLIAKRKNRNSELYLV